MNKYSVAVNNQRSKADQLEEDQRNLSDDIDSLQDAVETVPGMLFYCHAGLSEKAGLSGLRLCISPHEGR